MDLINSLPDHILIQIFGYLSTNMIKTCNLVCKRWDGIIGSSVELMSKFQLTLVKFKDSKKECKKLKRKYQSASIISLRGILSTIGRHNLQHLQIECLRKVKLSLLIEAVNQFPSLKVLAVKLPNSIDNISSGDFKKIQINLKELKCPAEIAFIFDCKSIKVLKMSCCNPVDENKKMLAIDFLKQEINIENLTLTGEYSNDFLAMPEILELNFALKKLNIEPDTDFWDFEMLINFLDRQKFSLTSFELPIWSKDVNEIKLINNYALENLIKLKHIEFGQGKIRNGEAQFPVDILQATKATKNIEGIAVSLPNDENDYKRFFALFPNLKHLRLDNGGILKVSFSNAINANLETLSFGSYEGDSDQPNGFAYFPNLKELSVELPDSLIANFIKQHSKTLEKLTFSDCDELTHEALDAIFNCTNLKYLELSIERASVYAIGLLNFIAARTETFTLTISYSLFRKTFIFPDDEVFFHEQMNKLKFKIDRDY